MSWPVLEIILHYQYLVIAEWGYVADFRAGSAVTIPGTIAGDLGSGPRIHGRVGITTRPTA